MHKDRAPACKPSPAPPDRSTLTHTVLRELRPVERRVLVMHWCDGLSDTEIAAAMGLDRDHAARIVQRVRQKAGPCVARLGKFADPQSPQIPHILPSVTRL